MKALFLAGLLSLAVIGSASAAETTEAEIKLFQFQPKSIEVKAGATIKWTNSDDIEHSVTAGAPGKETGAFGSDFFKKGDSFAHTFAEAGTFEYFCKRHNSMKAKVVVTP